MSWSLSVKPHSAAEILDAIDATEAPAHLAQEQLDQVHAAKAGAKAALEAGAVGDFDAEDEATYFAASLAGHSDGRGPGTSLNISVNQTAPPTDPGV